MGTVGLTEEQAREQISGDVDVFVSKFRPMKNTITGREEKTLIKILVEVATDKVCVCSRGNQFDEQFDEHAAICCIRQNCGRILLHGED